MWKLIVMFLCELVAFVLPFVCAILCLISQVTFSKFVLFVIFVVTAVCVVFAKILNPGFVKSVTAATGH